MATPRAAEHRDLEGRLRWIEDKLRDLTTAALSRSAMTVDGDSLMDGAVTVGKVGGAAVTDEKLGSDVPRIAHDTHDCPVDGSTATLTEVVAFSSAFAAVPAVTATAMVSDPGSAHVSVTEVSASGFTLLWRSDSAEDFTTSWVAAGPRA